ncbi:integrase [Paraburkholderia terricola]|uniref:Transposase InsO family protein n=1 Tax=Paraburkholderia terricola TaxID=169427 RepID=A0ABU1M1I0_9BURK|nr:integrase [Paraburkholderia terricola]MDR6412869.1 transposase InsO family protein [Paraburkholderia terricola]MDR6484772.1 transposase InsO family protein [Paraburkholderia terricola]
MTCLTRRGLAPALHDLSCWPTVDPSALSEPRRALFLRREQAIRQYVGGQSLALIESTTGVRRAQLYQLLARCAMSHADGRIQGFRALVPYARTRDYMRTSPTLPSTPGKRGGASGAMTQLLERHEALEAFLQRQIQLGKLHLGTRAELRGLRATHREFLSHCRELNLSGTHYPFNQKLLGIRSLAAAIRRLMANRTFAQAARAAGAQHVQRLRPPPDQASRPVVSRPFEVVVFDGHKLDIRLRIRVTDPIGLDKDIELERAWLLVVLDVCTRAVLGWHLALAAEYNRHDVIKAVQNALQPRRKRTTFLIAGLRYETRAGFISDAVRQTEYATWDWLRYDNARCHLAGQTLATVCDMIGSHIDAGPYAEPNERPYIERFFGTVGSTLSHRLPGTTGTSAQDVRRTLSDPDGKLSLLVTGEELAELLEVNFANYNGSPHDGLGGRSPIEMMQYFAQKSDGVLWRTLTERYRQNLMLLQPVHQATVRGNIRRGVRPYINLYGARYSSSVLGEASRQLGKPLRIYFDPEDMRVVMAFLESGEEVGPLRAARPWDQTPHSLRLRQEILRLKRLKEIDYGELSDPVEAYLKYQRRKSRTKQRRLSHRVAEAERALDQRDKHHEVATVPTSTQADNTSTVSLLELGKGQIFR